MSKFLRPQGLYSPWNSPDQNTGEGSLSILQGIFPTHGSNPGLPHCRWVLYQLSYQGSPEGERGEWKNLLKTQHSKTKITASGPITYWQIDGEKVEAVTDFIHWCSKITVDGDCSREIKRCLLLGRKAMTNLDNVLKSREVTLLTKVHIVKVIVFPVVMNGCESWTIKKAECWRIDAFELWCWRRLLRVPWTTRRWNQSILKEINPEYSLEGLRLIFSLLEYNLNPSSGSWMLTVFSGEIQADWPKTLREVEQ